MESEDGAMGLFQALEQFLEIIDATLTAGIVIAPAPPPVVEPGAGRVHHSVQHDVVAVLVDQPAAIDVQRGQRLNTLGEDYRGEDQHSHQCANSF